MERARIDEDPETNTTPMIDVVFLLIIFFLCIEFRVLEAKLPAFLPKEIGASSAPTEPREVLSVRVICTNRGTEVSRGPARDGGDSTYYLSGHEIRWDVGPVQVRDLDDLVAKLAGIRRDPSKLQANPDTGVMKPMDVVIEPGRATTYGDVASTLDAVRQAGFEDIRFSPGRGGR